MGEPPVFKGGVQSILIDVVVYSETFTCEGGSGTTAAMKDPGSDSKLSPMKLIADTLN